MKGGKTVTKVQICIVILTGEMLFSMNESARVIRRAAPLQKKLTKGETGKDERGKNGDESSDLYCNSDGRNAFFNERECKSNTPGSSATKKVDERGNRER